MKMPTLAVQRWSGDAAACVPEQGLLVLAVDAPDTPNRVQARQLVRAALAEVLGAHLGCRPAEIRLVSVPGQPLRLDRQGVNIGLSVSHEPGLSLAAIHFGGPVGVDLLRLPPEPEWRDAVLLLAQDYLGPAVAGALVALPAGERVAYFAACWAGFEAGLKLSGRGLEEWSPAVQSRLAGCCCRPLLLPAGFVGSLAVPAAQGGGAQFRQ
jgi:4'-phosphopantetheinyl transferase